MKKKLIFAISLCLSLTVIGCGNKKNVVNPTETVENTAETVIDDTSSYSTINAVNGFTFVVRNEDLSDNYVLNPSILNSHQSPFFYYLGSWGDDNGTQYYETVDIQPTDSPILIVTGDTYIYYSDKFSYDINTNKELSYSLCLVNSAEDFVKILNSIGVDNANNINYVEDDSFSINRTENTYVCKANITYKSRYGKDFSGIAVMYESDKGQSYMIAGGDNFTDENKKIISDKFVVCDNPSNALSYYPDINNSIYDLGGKSISIDFPSFFKVDTSVGGWYWSERCGFPDLFCANEYLRTCVLGTVYYLPVENTDTDSFIYAYSPYLYNPYSADNKSEVRDADGRIWTRYSYGNTSEVSNLNHTVLYAYVEGNYAYLFGVYYDNDTGIDYASYMDNAMCTLHISEGVSEPYTQSSDFFYNNFGVPAPAEEAVQATSTDAVPEPQSDITEPTGEENPQAPLIDSQDPTANMTDEELRQYILEIENNAQ